MNWSQFYGKRWFRTGDGSVAYVLPGDLYVDFRHIFSVLWSKYEPEPEPWPYYEGYSPSDEELERRSENRRAYRKTYDWMSEL
jgi:hypothetical protein